MRATNEGGNVMGVSVPPLQRLDKLGYKFIYGRSFFVALYMQKYANSQKACVYGYVGIVIKAKNSLSEPSYEAKLVLLKRCGPIFGPQFLFF